MKRIVVSVDRLVLAGFPHEDRLAIAAGLQGDLAQALAISNAAPGLARLGAVETVRAANVALAPNDKAATVGSTIGRAISKSLVR